MKITIETIPGLPFNWQMEGVGEYMNRNLIDYTSDEGYPRYKTTKRGEGQKVELSGGRILHVMCTKTKKGNYSFKVWNAK